MKILLIAEHDNENLLDINLSVVTAAKKISVDITMLIAGFNCAAVAKQASSINGVQQVLVADYACYAHFLAENLAALVVDLAGEFSYIFSPSTTFGKNVMPRVAALLDVTQVSDIIEVIDHETFVRAMYAGNVLASIRTIAKKKVITVRPTAFAKANFIENYCAIKMLNVEKNLQLTRYVGQEITVLEHPKLGSARVVVAGGRGLQSKENFKLIEELADKLQAAIGASRAAVDAGFVPNDYQVGQTGKVVAPELYIAIGISGAVQHLAGMKDSKIIVAINKDPDAPIFKVADYGLVGDLFEIVPELISSLLP
jgi:electron transfer flavoprotein alpha subunit